MTDQHEKNDAYSGIPWVYVTPKDVLNHPKGRLTLVLRAIGLFFIASALAKMALIYGNGAGVGLAVLTGLWPLLTGVGILLRAPWALVMAVVSVGFSLFSLMRNMGADQSVYYLVETLVTAGILFHLMDGDRPNFIYRHRYRKYSALKEREK